MAATKTRKPSRTWKAGLATRKKVLGVGTAIGVFRDRKQLDGMLPLPDGLLFAAEVGEGEPE